MDKKTEKINENEEPPIEDFFKEEEDPDKEQKKKRRKVIIRLVAGVIAFVFLINGVALVFSAFNLPALEFLKTSVQLSQREDIQQYKKAVVSIEGSGKKGTGFNIAADGYLITNFHLIENMNPIIVYFEDGQVFKAILVDEFPEVDIAILDIEGENLPTLSLAVEDRLNTGDDIYIVGNPLGLYQVANKGKLIGFKGAARIDIQVLAITASVFRGNSGSPVINEDGKVVGVVFATTVPRVNRGEVSEGLAIPIKEVRLRIP